LRVHVVGYRPYARTGKRDEVLRLDHARRAGFCTLQREVKMLASDPETYPRGSFLPDTSVCSSLSGQLWTIGSHAGMANCPAVVMNTGWLMEQGWVNA
jgi:hypothetical protein